jgi:hypothetical protein
MRNKSIAKKLKIDEAKNDLKWNTIRKASPQTAAAARLVTTPAEETRMVSRR